MAPAIGDVILDPGVSLLIYLTRWELFADCKERLFAPGVECDVSGDNNVECGMVSIIFMELLSCMFAVARAIFFTKNDVFHYSI